MRALTIALSLGLVFGGLAERGPIAHAQSAGVTNIKDELSPGEFRAYGQSSPKKLRSRIGDLTFTKGGFAGGYPSLETIDALKNELDFHKATQAYIWAVPIVSYARWLESHEELFGAKDGQIVRLTSPKAKQGILTANATTPYAVAFADLSRTGPLVFDIPKGMSAGVVNDIWQRGIHDFGMSGPDRGNGAKLLILAPQMAIPDGLDTNEYTVIRNGSNIAFLGIRALMPDPAEADQLLSSFRIFPYAKRANPTLHPIIDVDESTEWGQWQPHGMAYWKALKKIMDREVFEDRDRFFLSMLASLGLEKGQPLQLSAAQAEVLKEAAVIGEAMLKSITFDKPFSNDDLYKGTHWDQLMVVTVDDRDGDKDQLYRRAAFTWEAVSRGKAYYIEQAGIGQQYRTAYKDGNGNFLEGDKHYKLTMPPNAPAEVFWSIVVYDVNSRTLILNDEGRAALSSRTGLIENDDGSVTLHFSPELPVGVEKANWVQTNPDESWFSYLRFYGPTQAYFDQTYPLQDIMPVN